VQELLENFLRRRSPFGGPAGLRCGLVEKNFFVPNEEMVAFRQAAQAVAVEQELARLLRNVRGHSGYRAWFLDWTNPRGFSRHEKELQRQDMNGKGFHEQEIDDFLGKQQPGNGDGVSAEQTTQATNGQQKPTRGKSGRKHDQRSLRIQAFCYLEREKTPPVKMATIRRKLGEIFGVDSPINTNADVRIYKNRWVKFRQKNPTDGAGIEAEPFPETLINYAENQ
jgi:hypothetical protein